MSVFEIYARCLLIYIPSPIKNHDISKSALIYHKNDKNGRTFDMGNYGIDIQKKALKYDVK